MPTIAGLPAATSCTSADKLWINQGTGSDRDKSATLDKLVAGGLADAIVGFPAPTTPNGTETFPVVQSGVGKEISLKDALAVAGSNAAALSDPLSSYALVAKSGTAYRLDITKLLPQSVDVCKLTTNEATWPTINGGASVDFSDALAAAGFERGHLVIERRPPVLRGTGGSFLLSLRALLKGYAGSSSNSNTAVLSIPSAAFPSGWFTELSAVVGALINGHSFPFIYRSNASATRVQGICTMDITSETNLAIGLGIPWSTLMPTNSTDGAIVQGQFLILTDSGLPASF